MNDYQRPQLHEDIHAVNTPTEPVYVLPLIARPQLLADIAESQGGLEQKFNDE